jgi:type IV secretion system protein VirB2
MEIHNIASKGLGFVKDNKLVLAEMACMAVPAVCGATGTMPWDNGITSLKDNLTGPLPRMGCLIAIAVGGTLYAIGQSDLSRMGMKAAFGTAIACGAATLAGLFGGGEASGCVLF